MYRSETLVLLAQLVLKARPKDFLSCLKEFPLLVTASADFHPIFSVSSWVMNPFIEIQNIQSATCQVCDMISRNAAILLQ